MRPSDTDTGEELYECFDCGRRMSDADSRVCEYCGGKIRHLGRPRDL